MKPEIINILGCLALVASFLLLIQAICALWQVVVWLIKGCRWQTRTCPY